MRYEVVRHATEEQLRGAFAERWREIAREAVRRKGYCTAALSGGRTPAGFLRHLARFRGLPWPATHLFQVDERLVSRADAASNFRLLRQSLLDLLPAAPGSVHAVPIGGGRPFDAACNYEEDLLSFFVPREEGLPAFDLVVLGIGTDGHTASLFPGSAALAEQERLVVPVAAGVAGLPRVSLTLPVLSNAHTVLFIVTGAAKREILGRVLGGKDPALPAARVRPKAGRVVVFADAAAAPGAAG